MTSRRSRSGVDTDLLFGFADPLKFDDSVCQGEQRIIAAHSDVCARVHSCSSLPDKNTAREHFLASEALDAESLGIAVAPVS